MDLCFPQSVFYPKQAVHVQKKWAGDLLLPILG